MKSCRAAAASCAGRTADHYSANPPPIRQPATLFLLEVQPKATAVIRIPNRQGVPRGEAPDVTAMTPHLIRARQNRGTDEETWCGALAGRLSHLRPPLRRSTAPRAAVAPGRAPDRLAEASAHTNRTPGWRTETNHRAGVRRATDRSTAPFQVRHSLRVELASQCAAQNDRLRGHGFRPPLYSADTSRRTYLHLTPPSATQRDVDFRAMRAGDASA